MASVASQLIQEVTAHAQSDSLEDAWKKYARTVLTFRITYVLLIGSICFGHYYAHHQELVTMLLITTLVISFCKEGGGSVNVNLWFYTS